MFINKTRLIFGPPRAHTTSVWVRLSKNQNYFTSKSKEFNGYFHSASNREIIDEIYFKDYENNKHYVDCSLSYFSPNIIKSNLSKQFKKDILIYNIRNLKDFIISFYRMYYLLHFKKFDHESVFNLIIEYSKIYKFYVSLIVNKKYTGEICFIPEEKFDLNNILKYYDLPTVDKDNTKYNSSDELKKWRPIMNYPDYSIEEFQNKCKYYENLLDNFLINNKKILQKITNNNNIFFEKHIELFKFGYIEKYIYE